MIRSLSAAEKDINKQRQRISNATRAHEWVGDGASMNTCE